MRHGPRQQRRPVVRLELYSWFCGANLWLEPVTNVSVESRRRDLVVTITMPLPAVVLFVRSLDGDYFLCTEVADALGVSAATLRRLARDHPDTLGPSYSTRFGRMPVSLYSMDDIDRLQTHLDHRWPDRDGGSARNRPGRPRLWSDVERRDRRARYCAVAYRNRRATELAAVGNHAAAAQARRVAATIQEALAAEHGRARTSRRDRVPGWPERHADAGRDGEQADDA
jgi:hypothetical protein